MKTLVSEYKFATCHISHYANIKRNWSALRFRFRRISCCILAVYTVTQCWSWHHINLHFKLIYTVQAALCSNAEQTQMICSRGGSCDAVSLFTGLTRNRFWSILYLNSDGFSLSRHDQRVLIRGWNTGSALRQGAAEMLFVIYCANQLN